MRRVETWNYRKRRAEEDIMRGSRVGIGTVWRRARREQGGKNRSGA